MFPWRLQPEYAATTDPQYAMISIDDYAAGPEPTPRTPGTKLPACCWPRVPGATVAELTEHPPQRHRNQHTRGSPGVAQLTQLTAQAS